MKCINDNDDDDNDDDDDNAYDNVRFNYLINNSTTRVLTLQMKIII